MGGTAATTAAECKKPPLFDSDSCLPALVRKVSMFRRALLAEKKLRQEQEQANASMAQQLEAAQSKSREQDKQLKAILQQNAKLEQKLFMRNVEPLPEMSTEAEQVRILSSSSLCPHKTLILFRACGGFLRAETHRENCLAAFRPFW